MNKTDKNDEIPIMVVDITGKMDQYVTLEEFMKRTEYIEKEENE